jgi:hypothetical protein
MMGQLTPDQNALFYDFARNITSLRIICSDRKTPFSI